MAVSSQLCASAAPPMSNEPAGSRPSTTAERFLAEWGEQAEALGWTARDLFGLHEVPANPHPTYQRLSRYDCTGFEAAIETLIAIMNDESATAAARVVATRAILRRQDMMWTDALRVAVMSAGEDGRMLLARIAEKRARRRVHSASKP